MKRRWFAVLLTLVMLAGLTACGKDDPAGVPAPETPPVEQGNAEDEVLSELQQEITANDALLGVAHLGFAEAMDYAEICNYLESNGFYDVFPVLECVTEDHVALQEGGELYLVVPASADVELTVSSCVLDETDYTLKPDEELLQVTDGKPVLLRGNISDIMPNLLLTAKGEGNALEYAPCLSLMDGSLSAAEGIYDISDYGFLLRLWTETDGAYDAPIFCDIWYAQTEDGNGELRALQLSLWEDGTADYCYGFPYSELIETFTGTWEENEGRLQLDLHGGPVNGTDEYPLVCAFEWDYQSRQLILSQMEGDPILYMGETEYGWYEFLPFDAFWLAGSWETDTPYRDWVYQLNLLENGECHLYILEHGQQLACYAGWWTDNSGVLDLSMGLQSGLHPENPEWDYLGGTYLAERDGEELTLRFESGSILTLGMEEHGEEMFRLRRNHHGVTAQYLQDTDLPEDSYDRVIVDDTEPVDVAFTALDAVRDVRLWSLHLQDVKWDGSPVFDRAELYGHGTLETNETLVVTLTMYGDTPGFGISFVDADNVERFYSIGISGYDGSLELLEFTP